MSTNINFIYNETLSGVVDGVNKVFTSLREVDAVESLRLGGVEYTGFSYSGNVFTLTDAPTVALGSPQLDYFYLSVASSTTSDKTFGDMIDDVYEIVGQDSSSLQFPISLVKKNIVESVTMINDLRTNPFAKRGSYTFNKAKDSTAKTVSTTQIELGSLPTYIPSNGAIYFKDGSFVTYSSITDTHLSGLGNYTHTNAIGDRVSFGYRIPNGVKRVEKVLLSGIPLDFIDPTEWDLNRFGNVFTIRDGYLFIPWDANEARVITVNYVSNNILPELTTDIVDIDSKYWRMCSYYAAFTIGYDREDTRSQLWERRYNKLFNNYKAYLRQTNNLRAKIGSNVFAYLSYKR